MKYFLFQIRSALEDFKRNRVRTFLTSLGIMIGVLSVTMLIALGLGLKNYIKQQFEGLGANLIMVLPGSGFTGEGGGGGFGAGLVGGASFDESDIKNLKRIRGLKYVVPVYFSSSLIESGEKEKFGYVMGVNEEMFELMNIKTFEGVTFDKSDLTGKAKVGVMGYSLAEELFGNPEQAVGKTVRVKNQRIKVIGVAEKKGDQEMDSAFVIPYTTTFGGLNPDKTFWAIYLGVVSEDEIDRVSKEAEEVLLKRYEEEEFSITEQAEILSTVNQIFGIINIILVAIGSISLLVGGIGIMNIMYANVTERISEIGIRRALGATKKDILFQFLSESVLLCLFGGLVGLILSAIIVFLVRPFFPLELNVIAVSVALGVSTLIGIVFGVFPARRAANFTPIEAIRYE